MTFKSHLLVLQILLATASASAQRTPRPNVEAPGGIEVNTLTGNLFLQRTDLVVPGRGISTDVTFSFNTTFDTLDVGFGKGWTFSYNMGYSTYLTSVVILRSDGRQDTFLWNGSAYLPPVGVMDELEQYQSNQFRLTTKHGMKYFFDVASHKKLTKIEDANGNALTINYSNGKIASLTNPSGRSLAFTFTGGRLSQIADQSTTPNRIFTYEYSTGGDLACVSDPLGGETCYEYNDHHNLTRTTDKNGVPVSLEYDGGFRVSRIVSCLGEQRLTYADGKTFLTERGRDGTVRTTTYLLDAVGRLAEMKDPTGNRATFTYDANNNLTSFRDFNGNQQFYTYDPNGNLLTETDPAGRTTIYTYEPNFNKISSVKDRNGNLTSFNYNPADGNLLGVSAPLGVSENYGYNAQGNLVLVVNGSGDSTFYAYDGTGNLTSITFPIGSQSFTYDGAGNLATVTDGNGEVVIFTYDALNRLLEIEDPLGRTTTFTYDENGNLATETDPEGIEKTYGYDALDRLIFVTIPAGTTNYEYDFFGNLTKITDANGHATTYTYNAQNLVASTSDAAGNTTDFTYDANGNLLQKMLPNGKVITYAYDALNRLASQSYPENTDYFAYDNEGNLISASNNDATLLFTYDALHRLASKTIANWGKTVSYTYNTAGDRLTMTDPDGGVTTYSYDDNHRLISLTNPLNEITIFTYDAGGRLTRQDNANGTFSNYAYDDAGNLLQLSNMKSNGDTLSFFAYTYDDAGNRLTMTDLTGVHYYHYDENYRVDSVAYANGDTETFTYDGSGNRIGHSKNGNAYSYAYNAADMILSAGNDSFTFDANGNMTSKTDPTGTTTYEYDAQNRLWQVTLPGGETNVFRYDAFGTRISLTDTADVTIKFFNDGLNPFFELNQSNSTISKYTTTLGIDGLISMDKNGQRYFFHKDILGSTIGLSDIGGVLVSNYEYGVFGEIKNYSGSLTSPYTYTGRYYDKQVGLYYFRLRHYNQSAGRFTQKDPLSHIDGTNLFQFTANNPLNWTDPLGLYSSDELLYDAANFSAGMGDALSFGMTRKIREWMGSDDVVNHNSGHYFAGSITGTTVGTFSGGFARGISLGLKGTAYGKGALAAKSLKPKEIRAAIKSLENAARRKTSEIISRGKGEQIHHIFTLWGHKNILGKGGGSVRSYFPIVGLPRWMQNFKWNLISLKNTEHIAAHRNAWEIEKGIILWDKILSTSYRSFNGLSEFLGNQSNGLSIFQTGIAFTIPIVAAFDPNDILGPPGYDSLRWVAVQDRLGYTVRFENDPDFATAPAQHVLITLPVDPHLNILSFRLGDFGFGSHQFSVPPNTSFYTARLDLSDSLGVLVDVTAGIDLNENKAFWIFQAIDPATGLPPADPLLGFLPVNDTMQVDSLVQMGEGFVNFSIEPNSADLTGDTAATQAVIVFDENAPIATNTWTNVVDAFAPTSAVAALPAASAGNSFTVSWSVTDDPGGVGVASVDLYVRRNGGNFYLYQNDLDTTAILFTGQADSSYCFYTIATDLVGNREAEKTDCEASITLGDGCVPNLVISTATIAAGVYRSQGPLTANTTTISTGQVVRFLSDTSVTLQQNFTVQVGAEFEAKIEACPANKRGGWLFFRKKKNKDDRNR